jgi:hypothetical protein
MNENPLAATAGAAGEFFSSLDSVVAVAESCIMNENPLVAAAGAAGTGSVGVSDAGSGAVEFIKENDETAGVGAAASGEGTFMKPNELKPGDEAAGTEGSEVGSGSSSASLVGVVPLISKPPNIVSMSCGFAFSVQVI